MGSYMPTHRRFTKTSSIRSSWWTHPIICYQMTLLECHESTALWYVTSLAYFWASKIPTPPLPAAFGLNQLLSPSVASKIQLAHPYMSPFPRLSSALPLNLCSWSITTSALGVNKFIKHLSLAILYGSLSPQMLCVIKFHFMYWLTYECHPTLSP